MPNTAPETTFSITVPPVTADTTPDTLPWAVDGTNVAPDSAQVAAGYSPYPAPPPIYSLENFARSRNSQWLERLSATGFFAQRATSRVTISGTVTAGNTYTLTQSALSDTYTATSADAAAGTPLLSVVTNWAQQLRTSDLANILVGSVGGTGILDVIYRDPATAWPGGSPTVSETGTNTIAIVDRYGGSAGQLSVMTAAAGTGANGADLLHGVGTSDGAATKLQFRKGSKNGAFRAGTWSGSQANLANVGASSAAFGDDTEASGVTSFAAGNASVASGDASVAMGSSNTAAGENSVALGKSNAVTSDESMALGVSNVLNGVRVVAIGSTNFPTGDHAVAIGTTNSAAADYSTAIGKNAAPDTYGEAAIASGCFSANGDSQMGFTIFRRDSVDNVGMIVTTDGTGTGISIYLKSSNVYAISMDVTAKWLSGSGGGAGAGDCAVWRLNFMASVDGSGVVTITGMAATNVAPSQSVGQGSTYRLGYLSTANAFVLRAYSGHNSNTIRVVGSSRHTNV